MDDLRRLERELERRLERLFLASNKEAIRLVDRLKIDPSKPFSFDDYPELRRDVERLFNNFRNRLEIEITSSISKSWYLAEGANDRLVDALVKVYDMTPQEKAGYYKNNHHALNQFLHRRDDGMDLSTRVWNMTEQYKRNIEGVLRLGITKGQSAYSMTRNLMRWQRRPQEVIEEARAYHKIVKHDATDPFARDLTPLEETLPTQRGLYRSTYKNAMRLAVTETNMAYRASNHTRWQQLDFVIGQKIQLSPNGHTIKNPKTGEPEPFYDMCDELLGDYPKWFFFTGWHPNCRCISTPILKTKEEFFNDKAGKGEIKELPENFNSWVQINSEKIMNAKNLPYFIKYNWQEVNHLLT